MAIRNQPERLGAWVWGIWPDDGPSDFEATCSGRHRGVARFVVARKTLPVADPEDQCIETVDLLTPPMAGLAQEYVAAFEAAVDEQISRGWRPPEAWLRPPAGRSSTRFD